jgi:hypothetical protein
LIVPHNLELLDLIRVALHCWGIPRETAVPHIHAVRKTDAEIVVHGVITTAVVEDTVAVIVVGVVGGELRRLVDDVPLDAEPIAVGMVQYR